jgi:uncharacterized protein YecE (DUF72 family)
MTSMAQAYVGTSGFDYREWKPSFYPPDLARAKFLGYYASRFGTVELNNTFYQMPSAEKLSAWCAATPASFRFTLKVPRRITHQERLKTPSESLSYLVGTVQPFRQRMASLLFQFPPFLRSDNEKLAHFLQALPAELPAAFEFRHESWFTEETYALLEKRGAALCINDGDDSTSPIRVTSGFAYLRLRRSHYTDQTRDEWVERIRDWTREGIDVFAYVKHEDNPDAPRIALQVAEAVSGKK